MNVESPAGQGSKIRKKETAEVELILEDGTTLSGEVFVLPGERVQDLLNGDAQFFPVRLEDHEILLISKSSIVICKPLDSPG